MKLRFARVPANAWAALQGLVMSTYYNTSIPALLVSYMYFAAFAMLSAILKVTGVGCYYNYLSDQHVIDLRCAAAAVSRSLRTNFADGINRGEIF